MLWKSKEAFLRNLEKLVAEGASSHSFGARLWHPEDDSPFQQTSEEQIHHHKRN